MSDLKFKATVDSKKGEVSLKNLDKGVDKVEKSTKKAGAGFKSLAVGLAAGVAAFAVATKALRGLVRWMGDAIELAAIQQTAENEVAAALESTGREVANNVEHFKEYASELQNATTYGDEQILSTQALMIQLTRLDREGLDMATKGAIGLASVYKTDLQAATTLVGKALAGNYGALSRYGIMVERTATDEEKRASVLQQLQTMYQRAEADTDTYAGAVKQLSNVYGDLKEEVGKAVTENEDFRDTLKTITELTKDLIESGLVEWVTDIAVQAIKSAPMMESLAKSLALVLLIYKIQAEKLKKVDERTVEWIGHLQQEDDLQRSLRKQIAGVIEVTEEQAVSIKTLAGEFESELTFALQGAGAEVEKLDGVMGEPKPGAEKYVLVYGKITNAVKEMTEAQQEFADIALAEFWAMEASMKGFVNAILNTLEQWALGEIVKSVLMTLPFPLNLLATGGAMLAVKAIFAEIKGMEKGGWVGLQGPEIIKVGERGPEYVTSNSQITNIYNQSASPSGIRRIIIQNRITIGEQTFYKETVKSVNKAGTLGALIIPNKVVI